MRRVTLIFCLNVFFISLALAQLRPGQVDPAKVPLPDQHYQVEYTFDAPSNPARWKTQKQGLNVSFGSTDELYLRSEAPSFPQESQRWEEAGWKGERLNAQVVVWSPDTLKQVRFTVSDLTSANGKVLGKNNIHLNMVRYILSNYPYGATNAICDVGANDTAYLMPDRFEAFDRFDLPGRTVRSVWIMVDIPAATEAGIYRGAITVDTEKHHATLNISVRVQNMVLPKPHDWKFRLDLWQNPWVVAGYYQLEPWSEEHKALLKKHLKLYADAGGKYITTYAVHSPWSDNSYRIEGGMIDWVKRTDGTWKFDYDIFDQYVQLAMEAGIDEAITIYTPVPWGYRFRYRDEKTGNYVYEEWPPASAQFKAVWNVFLDDLKAHLEKKGWFKKTYLGINENPLDITMAAAKVIKEHSKDWRITYAGDWHPELTELLDDYSPVITSEPSPAELSARKARNFTTTYYVCCTPAQPNNFVFSPPVEGRYIGWYSAAFGYDGFLRWAYDAWPEDPMRDARHTVWPAGDCFIVYPGGTSSIRFEKLREGIADFEKIRIVKALAAKSTDKKIKASLKEFETHLASFARERTYSKRDYSAPKMTADILKGEKMIEALSNDLGR